MTDLPRVRRLGPGDALLFRDIRLTSLKSAPESFASRYEDLRDRPLSEFAARLADTAYFAGIEGGKAVGLIGWHRNPLPAASHRGEVIAVFILPVWRGSGLFDRLVGAVLDHAASTGLRQLELNVAADNTRARAAYGRLGFSEIGMIPTAIALGDGFQDDVLMWRSLTG